MVEKPTYEELEQRAKALEYELIAVRISKEAEEALRESEEKYRTLVEAIEELIWEVDTKGFYTYISHQAYALYGFKPEEVIGKTPFDFMPPDEGRRVKALFDQMVASQQPFVALESMARHKDGHLVFMENRGSPFFAPDGRLKGYRGIAIDITTHKRAEEAIRESEERLALALKATRDGIFDWNISENTSYTSPHLRDMLGIEEGVNPRGLFSAWTSRIHPEDREHMVDALRRHLKGASPFNVDFLLCDKNGQYRWRNINGMALFDENGKACRMVGAIQDIHDRKQAERHIRTLTQKLIEAQEKERQIISRELHDRVAQDLSTSKIACDLILGHEPGLTPEVMKKVSEISNTLESSIFAVRDLAYDLRPFGLEDLGLIQTVYLYCEDFSEKSGLKVDFHYAGIDNLRFSLYDEINIFRLVQEGLNNIWRHADASHAIVRLLGAYPNVILRIEDDGKGFDVKKRVAAAMEEKRMGLRSMEERAGLLQGKMTLQSRPNEGTLISIKFPCRENINDGKENHIDH